MLRAGDGTRGSRSCVDPSPADLSIFPLALSTANYVESPEPMADKTSIVTVERVERLILLIRGYKVMLDSDLAELYGVTTFNLNKAVKRNSDRFPQDFMFQLTAEVARALRFQIGMSKPKGQGGSPILAVCVHGTGRRHAVERSPD